MNKLLKFFFRTQCCSRRIFRYTSKISSFCANCNGARAQFSMIAYGFQRPASPRVIPSRVKITINWVGNTMLVSYIRGIVPRRASHAAYLHVKRLKTFRFLLLQVRCSSESGLAYLELTCFCRRCLFRSGEKKKKKNK